MNRIRRRILYSRKFPFLLVLSLLTAGGYVQSADNLSGYPYKFYIADAIAQMDSNQGEVLESDTGEQYYMYKDGDVEKYVILRKDLVMERYNADQQDNTNTLPKDAIIFEHEELRVVKKQSWHQEKDKDLFPVFESMNGTLMTLPGGVVLVFDSKLSKKQRDDFFVSYGIDLAKVSSMKYAKDVFVIETEPGFPALELANKLAEAKQVVISTPNWWSNEIDLYDP